ncbi:MAG TPA: hypothetical protein VF587_09435 [Solirubrobacteraceae bacterium]|jgi:hypothetical protein
MRRFLLLVTIATTAFAGVAFAAAPKSGTFKAGRGQIQNGYDLKFTVKGGKIKNLVAHVLETCDGASTSTVTTVGPSLAWKITGGKFNGRKKETQEGVTLYTTLKGRFTSATTAKGVLRQESIVAGSTCDTYELKFTAKR